MEKYTVDIDKVLDDFEESEALERVLSSQMPAESIYAEPWEHLTKSETKCMPGSKVNSDLKLIKGSHQERPNKQDCIIEPPDSSSLKENDETNPQQNDYNENKKLWDYEIFYKPFQSMSLTSQSLNENGGHLGSANQSVSSESNVRLLHSDNNLSDIQEEILCVSVQEKDYGVENSVEQTNSKSSYLTNSALQNDCNSELFVHNSFSSNTKNFPLSCESQNVVGLSDSSQKSELSNKNFDLPVDVSKEYSKEKISESLNDKSSSTACMDKLSNLHVERFPSLTESSRSVIPDGQILRCLTDQKTAVRKEIREIKRLDIPPTSCLYDKISGQTKFSTEMSQNPELAFASLDIKQPRETDVIKQFSSVPLYIADKSQKQDVTEKVECPVPTASEPTTVSFFDKFDTKDITVEEMDEYLENLSDIDPIQDEDSGVSSQEDINGNAFASDIMKKSDDSKILLINQSNAGNNLSVSSNFEVINCDKIKGSTDSISNKITKVKDSKYLEVQSENLEKSKTSAADEMTILPCLPDSIRNDKTNKFTLQSKYETIVEDSSVNLIDKNTALDESSKTIDDNNTIEVIKPCGINKTHRSHNLNSNLDKLNQNLDVNISVNSNNIQTQDNTTNQSEASFQCYNDALKSSDVTLIQESKNETVDTSAQNVDYRISSTDFDPDSSCEDAAVSALNSNKLQRPTTLNLPSRHIAKMDTSDEIVSSITSDNTPDKPHNETSESLIDTPLEDPKVSDSSEYIKPQPQIGVVKPFWIPDADAPNCMHCGVKFTVIKRRHHCRACGKVLCSRCCNQKAKLLYLQNKEDRICQPCAEILSSTPQTEKVQAPPGDSQSSSSCGSSPNFSPTPQVNPSTALTEKSSWRPHPNNPDDYCSTIPPLQQIQLSGTRPPPTVMVPIGVLKRGNKPRREPKQVIFSDGIRPGGDLTDLTETVEAVPACRRLGRRRVDKIASGDVLQALSVVANPGVKKNVSIPKSRQRRIVVSDEEGPLPPILLPLDNSVEKMDLDHLLLRLNDGEQRSVVFAVTKNMHVISQITKLDCCFGKECWCFTSHGLCTVGQDEVMIVLERLPDEKIIPRDIFKLFTKIYDSASKGITFEELSHIIFPEGIFGSCEQTGFLFVRPTFQCLNKLPVPNTPFLVAILIQKWEVPWANVFPLRLMLRLGAECRYYPCALVSVRCRKPVYFEIGQTIMSVLADLRNYQFTIPTVPGLVVHMEEKKTCVNIPRNRYDKVMKVLSSNNVEHVLALGSNFSTEADSHLVCMQKDDGDYHTQAINIENTTRRVTGASFIVFSGALKTSSGLSAKFSIVEDGLLVQIPQETMVALHLSLRDMKDLTIPCGEINATDPDEVVVLQWVRDHKKFNIGVRSPIDGKCLEGVQSLRIHTSTDYAGEHYLIRWTEVFFLEVEKSGSNRQNEMVDPCRFAETIAQSCCMALTPYLDMLADADLKTIGLRVALDSERDKVEYDVGACGKPLPGLYMNALDSGLIPVILRLSGSSQNEPVALELIFHVLFK